MALDRASQCQSEVLLGRANLLSPMKPLGLRAMTMISALDVVHIELKATVQTKHQLICLPRCLQQRIFLFMSLVRKSHLLLERVQVPIGP